MAVACTLPVSASRKKKDYDSININYDLDFRIYGAPSFNLSSALFNLLENFEICVVFELLLIWKGAFKSFIRNFDLREN